MDWDPRVGHPVRPHDIVANDLYAGAHCPELPSIEARRAMQSGQGLEDA